MISDTINGCIEDIMQYIREDHTYISSSYINEEEFIEALARLDAIRMYFENYTPTKCDRIKRQEQARLVITERYHEAKQEAGSEDDLA